MQKPFNLIMTLLLPLGLCLYLCISPPQTPIPPQAATFMETTLLISEASSASRSPEEKKPTDNGDTRGGLVNTNKVSQDTTPLPTNTPLHSNEGNDVQQLAKQRLLKTNDKERKKKKKKSLLTPNYYPLNPGIIEDIPPILPPRIPGLLGPDPRRI